MRHADWDYVHNLISDSDPYPDNPQEGHKFKHFWTYLKHCKQNFTGISSHLDQDGKLHKDPQGIAETLNIQFICFLLTLSSKSSPMLPHKN